MAKEQINRADDGAKRHGNRAIFLVSLDFEMYWGVRDKRSIAEYRENLSGVRAAIPRILELFEKAEIHGTWAAVGLLFCENQFDAIRKSPTIKPNYSDTNLCPYKYLESCEEIEDEYHFAPDLIRLIAGADNQEIATHTYSHYYCLEHGQTQESFDADIVASIDVAASVGVQTKSIVFPRNQWNSAYLANLEKLGITSYRGNEESWLYDASGNSEQGTVRRLLRLIDAYVNISGHNTYALLDKGLERPVNFPSSRFLRPYDPKLSVFDWLRQRRIVSAMRNAVKESEVFHLWWHPHNFGTNLEKNLEFLSKILDEYRCLRDRSGMTSLTMSELAESLVLNEK